MAAIERRLLELRGVHAPEDFESAFREVYEHYQPFVTNVIRALVGSEVGIDEDLTQDTFLKVHLHLDQYRGDSAFSSWLYRVAANVCLDHLRKDRLRRKAESVSLHTLPDSALTDGGYEEAAISRCDLERLLEQLAPGQREKLILYDLVGMNHREIGEHTGVAADTSRAHYRQARKRAKEISDRTQE